MISINFKKNIIVSILLFTITIIVILGVGTGLTGCSQINSFKNNMLGKFSGNEESDRAVAAANDFFNALIQKNYDKAYEYIYADKKKTLENFRTEMKNITDIISFKVNSVEVKNNIALVSIDFIDSYDGEEKIYNDLTVSLVKDKDNKWKINFWN